MMGDAHTPGPWRVSTAKPTKTRGIDILAGYAATVAHVPVPPSYMPSRADGDAQLISAAPDLLAAVKEAVAAVESGDLYGPLCCGGGAECGCRGASNADLLLHDLRAAILKAEGDGEAGGVGNV